MEFMQTVRLRRSVRRFTSRPVPDEVLAEILEAGRLAPSSGGSSSTYFGVVRDEATKHALAAVSGGQDWIADAPVVIALCSRLSPDPADRAPDDFFVTVNTDRFGADLLAYLNAYPDRKAMRVFFDNGFPVIPGAHVALAAVDQGLAGCWIGHLDTAAASRILNLPDDVVCLFLMPIGYPGETPADKSLRPLDECVFNERWSE
jgi:nitroreductase